MNKPNRVSLDVIDIASPCPAAWDEMRGDDRVRYCGECRLNVYNLSEMSRTEAEAFVSQREGRACIRIYRRADGKTLTRDCPIGLRAVRRRLARMAAAIAAMLSGLAISALFGRSSQAGATNATSAAGPLAKFAAWLDPPWVWAVGDICLPPSSNVTPTLDELSEILIDESAETAVPVRDTEESASTP